MLIAKHVAGFEDSQADSILRKALAKKKADKMELARRLFIYGKINAPKPVDYDEENLDQPIYDPTGKHGAAVKGGINNGWTEAELKDFWEKLKGYASYLFNKSHSASYGILTLCTMYLKRFYRAKFFAALLSMQNSEDKINLYVKTAKDYGINIKAPDVNNSQNDFIELNDEILYGLKTIKGVGSASIPNIIANRPYKNIQDCIDKLDSKSSNKRIGMGLIKAGAFDF
jgi:DNA polymerase-3 subunit alpha